MVTLFGGLPSQRRNVANDLIHRYRFQLVQAWNNQIIIIVFNDLLVTEVHGTKATGLFLKFWLHDIALLSLKGRNDIIWLSFIHEEWCATRHRWLVRRRLSPKFCGFWPKNVFQLIVLVVLFILDFRVWSCGTSLY